MGRRSSLFSLLLPPCAFALGSLTSVSAFAQDEADEPSLARPVPPPPPASDEATGTEFQPRFVLDTGRAPVATVADDAFKVQVHGEYQVRLTGLSDLPLATFQADPSTSTLGQTVRLYHWLRITPRAQLGEKLKLIGQIDVPRGLLAAHKNVGVDTSRLPFDDRQPFEVHPRWLYLEWLSPVGLLRVGQQPSHWGMGIIANDGDHPSLFGDYYGGSIVERVLFATRPLGRESPFNVALAGDLVFEDNNAKLVDDERAFQGVLAAFYADKHDNMLGFYGVYRHQRNASAEFEDVDETLKVFALDSAGKFNAKIPGTRGHLFGEYEVAYIFGDTNLSRTQIQSIQNEREKVRQFGAAASIGAVTTAGEGDQRWGDFVAQLEWGWASGDADPNDGVQRRFRFDPNHNVGLIIFDEALKWKTARAANIARDPNLSARPQPGSDLLPSNGAVFGASYLNPTVVVRPTRELDLKAGAVVAQTTADFVDPVQVGTQGRFVNYDGGSAFSHDLGLELDAGFEYRLALDFDVTLELGAQGGVFFPGNAFADAAGNRMATQYIGVGRLGLQF